MINEQISDLIEQSTKNISAHNPQSVQDIKIAPALITYSPAMQQQQQELKQFLRRNLYQHYLVTRMTEKAHRIITELFDAFMTEPKLLPPQYLQKAAQDKPRAIADYIAGMTDRYAIKEYRRLFVVEEI